MTLKVHLFDYWQVIYEEQPVSYAHSFFEHLFPTSDSFEIIIEKIDSIIIDLKVNELPTLKKKLVEKKDYVKRR